LQVHLGVKAMVGDHEADGKSYLSKCQGNRKRPKGFQRESDPAVNFWAPGAGFGFLCRAAKYLKTRTFFCEAFQSLLKY
jgi:hypothetical protein